MARSRMLLGAGALVLAVAGVPATAGAGAVTPDAAAFAHIDASGFTLNPGNTFDTAASLITRLEGDPRIHRVSLSTVVTTASPGHTGTWPLCHTTYLDPAYSPSGFCWDSTDDTTSTWAPQGVTGSGDADASGLVGGRRLVAASWHGPDDTYARVSIADYSKPSAGVLYHHLLLVKPTVDSAGNPTFTQAADHADGLMWYGDKLFLATGRRLEVYSLDHIWATQTSGTDAGEVGLYPGGAYARWHAWALPMIGYYLTTPSASTGCVERTGTTPCLNSISLAPSRDSFVTAEFHQPNEGGGRVIRWPLDATTATGLPAAGADGKVHATEAFSSPIWHMQGVATDGTAFYLAGDCPGGVSANAHSCIHRAVPDQAPHVLTTAPPLLENLAYWPGSGELWGVNEAISSTGKRVVFKIHPNG
ncbi:MAG: hypothetical protein ACJ73S_13595 [Mycobacteriales bacterium]